MSGGQETDTETGNMPGDRLSVGARLVAAREQHSLTTEGVASQLRLDVTIIEALENDDASGLPAPIFVQGYVRSYARLLGLPEEELVRDYASHSGEPPPLTVNRAATSLPFFRLPSGRLLRNVILAMLAAIMLWLAYPLIDRLLETRGEPTEEHTPGHLEIPPADR